MSILTFKGGVHPYDGKELSKDIPTRQIYPDGEVVIPVAQHIGAPAKPIVNVGDRVLVGQKIAEANGFVSANIHSSVSGTVKKIEQRLVPNGSKVLSVVIENDEQYEKFEYEKPDDNLSREEKIELIKDCGVVGLGGACFPTHVKWSPFQNQNPIGSLVLVFAYYWRLKRRMRTFGLFLIELHHYRISAL